DDGAEFAKTRCDRLVFVSQMDFFPVQSHICQNHSCPQVGLVAENGVTDIVKMRDLGPVEYYAIFKLAGVTKDYAVANDHIFADITTASYLATISDPGRTFNGRAVFDDSFVTDIDPVAYEGSAKQTSAHRRIEAELKITGDLLQNIPDLGRVI